MRTSQSCGMPAIVIFFLCLSCNILEPPLSLGTPRDIRSTAQARPGGGSGGLMAPDTSILVSAVCFPSSYDWQRDSAFGAVACTLKLFRGAEQLMSLPAGPSSRISVSPDRHHILGSSLFTDYDDIAGTTVKRNGATVGEWKDAEILRGLLWKDGMLHTLGISRSSGAMVYRQDSKTVLKIDRCEVLGGFGRDTYGASGSLYEDEGCVCFGYRSVKDGMTALYLVRDGVPELQLSAPGAEILDAKVLSGVPVILYNQAGLSSMSIGPGSSNVSHSGSLYWLNGGVLEFDGRPSVAGRFRDKNGRVCSGVGWDEAAAIIKGEPAYIYCDGKRRLGLSNPVQGHEDCYFFHRGCAALTARGPAMVLTPKDASRPPFLIWGKETVSYRMHGYLSSLSLEI